MRTDAPRSLAGITTALLFLLGVGPWISPAPLSGQQEGVQGRQESPSAAQIQQIQSRIQQSGDRAVIGLKPADARRGVSERGRRLMAPDRAPEVARRVLRRTGFEGARIERSFRSIPAVVVTLDPANVRRLIEDTRVDYVEADIRHRPVGGAALSDASAAAISAAGRAGLDDPAARLPTDGEPPVSGDPTADRSLAQTVPWGVERVNASGAWSARRGAGVRVGILDSGIDQDHPDLDPQGGINTITGGTSRSAWDDAAPSCNGHGTHVAGTVAALDNTSGVVGVAPDADVFAVRVFDPTVRDVPGCLALTSDIVAGIDWSVRNDMDVINLSLGSEFPSRAEADALAVAYANGVLPVAAAGNSGRDEVGFPAGFPSAIAVSAIDRNDALANFSNTGPEVELTGPGVDVLSTLPGGGTGTLSGTSFAAPHVAGVAALLRSAGSGRSVEQLRSLLRSTADATVGPNDTGYDEFTGDGVPNGGAAVAAVLGGANVAVSPAELELNADPGGSPVQQQVTLTNEGDVTASWSAMVDQAWLSVTPSSGSLNAGEETSVTVTADPSGLASTVHRAFLSFEGFDNAPVDVRTRLAVAPSVPVDNSVTTRSTLASADARKRFRFSGTAGQRVDIAVMTDDSASNVPLQDPDVKVYAPDGETVIANRDFGRAAGTGLQPVIPGLELPRDGEYFIEVTSGPFEPFGNPPFAFLVKVRNSGPILGFSPAGTRVVDAREGGSPGTTSFDIFNLTGTGSLDWTITAAAPWLSVSPGTGTASRDGPTEVAVERPAYRELRRLLDRPRDEVNPERIRTLVREEIRHRMENPEAGRWTLDPDQTQASVTTGITVEADPTGLSPGDQRGTLAFSTPANWLAPFQFQSVSFRVYNQEFELLSSDAPFEGMDSYQPDRSFGITFPGSEIRPINADGSVGSPVTTVQAGVGSFVGLEQAINGDWFLVPNNTLGPIYRVDRDDGSSSEFARIPGFSLEPAVGPNGGLFAPSFGFDVSASVEATVFQVSPDGSSVSGIGPSIPGSWAAAFNPSDGRVYVSALDFETLHRINPTDGSGSLLLDIREVTTPGGQFGLIQELEVGSSGLVYGIDLTGRVWEIDPAGPTASFLGWSPFNSSEAFLASIALQDGQMVGGVQTEFLADGTSVGEVFRRSLSDSPAALGDPGLVGTIDARFATGTVETLRGEEVTIPLRMDLNDTPEDVASYAVDVSWNPDQLDFVDVEAGGFGGSFTTDTGNTGSGALSATSARAEGVTDTVPNGTVDLLRLTVQVADSIPPGTGIQLSSDFTELTNEAGEDLLALLSGSSSSQLASGGNTAAQVTTSSALCVADFAFGDGNQDGDVTDADATQIQRALLDLQLDSNANPDLFDVDTDGETSSADAVQILRFLVDLSIPGTSRVERFGVSGGGACP